MLISGQRSGVVISSLATQQEGSEFDIWVDWLNFLCKVCMFYPCLCGSSPKTWIRPTGHIKLLIGLNVNGCLSRC